MAHSEFAVQLLEAGSNNMNTYQTLMDAVHNGSDSLSIVQNTVGVVAIVTNIVPMLQPVRITANGLVATTVMAKIVADWSDPAKSVRPGDVLTLVSASGAVAIQLLVWAEIGEGVALTVAALALAADVQTDGYSLATYDEILMQKGLFICLSDQGTSGPLFANNTPIPGSLTPVNEEAYKENYCRYLSVEQGWSDIVSGMDYCKNVKFR